MLHQAVASGDVDRVRQLIAYGAPLEVRDGEGRTPLLTAVRLGNVDIARALIEAGADVNAKDSIRDTPFLYAGAEGMDEILDMILASGRAKIDDTNRYGGIALIPAAHHGHPSTVKRLIRAGLNVDHVNNLGWTALIEVVVLGDGGPIYQEIARTLIAAGARPLPDRDGKSPLELARAHGFHELAAILKSAYGR